MSSPKSFGIRGTAWVRSVNRSAFRSPCPLLQFLLQTAANFCKAQIWSCLSLDEIQTCYLKHKPLSSWQIVSAQLSSSISIPVHCGNRSQTERSHPKPHVAFLTLVLTLRNLCTASIMREIQLCTALFISRQHATTQLLNSILGRIHSTTSLLLAYDCSWLFAFTKHKAMIFTNIALHLFSCS